MYLVVKLQLWHKPLQHQPRLYTHLALLPYDLPFLFQHETYQHHHGKSHLLPVDGDISVIINCLKSLILFYVLMQRETLSHM